MTIVIAELYEALIAAGAPENQARAASKTSFDHRFAKSHADLLVLKCMCGAIIASTATLVIKAFL